MNLRRIALAAVVFVALPFSTAAKCPAGTPSGPAESPEKNGKESACEVKARALNSNSQMVLTLRCYDNAKGTDVTSSAIIGPDQYPRCVPGTFWPGCKDA